MFFKHLKANTTIIVVHFKNVPRSNSNTKNHWVNSKQLSACEASTPTLTSYLVVPIFLTTVNGISPSVTSLLRSKFKTNFKNFARLENSTVNLNQDTESTSNGELECLSNTECTIYRKMNIHFIIDRHDVVDGKLRDSFQ